MGAIAIGELTIDLETQTVARSGEPVHLTPLEFKVLAYLAANRGRSICTTELLETIWHASISKGGTTAQVKNCIKRIRRKIEADEKRPWYLLSRRGWGYILRDPLAQSPTDQESS
jgi:two-component system KDP operon response regulator KdpE